MADQDSLIKDVERKLGIQTLPEDCLDFANQLSESMGIRPLTAESVNAPGLFPDEPLLFDLEDVLRPPRHQVEGGTKRQPDLDDLDDVDDLHAFLTSPSKQRANKPAKVKEPGPLHQAVGAGQTGLFWPLDSSDNGLTEEMTTVAAATTMLLFGIPEVQGALVEGAGQELGYDLGVLATIVADLDSASSLDTRPGVLTWHREKEAMAAELEQQAGMGQKELMSQAPLEGIRPLNRVCKLPSPLIALYAGIDYAGAVLDTPAFMAVDLLDIIASELEDNFGTSLGLQSLKYAIFGESEKELLIRIGGEDMISTTLSESSEEGEEEAEGEENKPKSNIVYLTYLSCILKQRHVHKLGSKLLVVVHAVPEKPFLSAQTLLSTDFTKPKATLRLSAVLDDLCLVYVKKSSEGWLYMNCRRNRAQWQSTRFLPVLRLPALLVYSVTPEGQELLVADGQRPALPPAFSLVPVSTQKVQDRLLISALASFIPREHEQELRLLASLHHLNAQAAFAALDRMPELKAVVQEAAIKAWDAQRAREALTLENCDDLYSFLTSNTNSSNGHNSSLGSASMTLNTTYESEEQENTATFLAELLASMQEEAETTSHETLDMDITSN